MQTPAHTVHSLLHALEGTAKRDAAGAFATLARAIDWSLHPARELERAIDLALSLDLFSLAVELAQKGMELFPDHESIRRLAAALAPPAVREVQTAPPDGLASSRTWIREHAVEYRGQWVAVRDGELLSAAGALDDLEAVVGEQPANTVVTKVL